MHAGVKRMSQLANQVNGSQQIERADFTAEGPELDPRYTDDGAVQLVIQDTQRASTFLEKKQWNLFWREADVLYQSPRTNTTFEGSTVARANVSRFTVAQHVNALVPTMKNGIFYENPPFMMRPRPSTKQATARAKTALYGALLEECDFENEAELALEDMTTFGTVICKAGFDRYILKKKRRRPKKAAPKVDLPFGKSLTVHTIESDELEVVDDEIQVEEIYFERCELGSVFIDPTWKSPNNLHKGAKYLVFQSYPTFKDLDRMRQQKVEGEDGKIEAGYDIPGEDELIAFFTTHPQSAAGPGQVQLNQGGQNWAIHHAQGDEEPASADPTLRPIRMLERWDRTYVYAVLTQDGGDRGVLIRKEEHGLPFIPFFAANFWNIPNAGYGLGVGRLAGSDQRIDKGLTDAVLDILSYAVNPQYVRSRAANVPTQQIRQRLGGIIDVDPGPTGNTTNSFRLLEMPEVPASAFPVLQDARQSARSTTGADEAFTQGNTPTKGTTALRTATVGGGIMAANTAKIQGPVGHFVRGVFLPFLELMDFFVKNEMSLTKIRSVLGPLMAPDFELDAQNFYDADDKFEVLAGAHLAAKKAAAQALPLLVQIFENPQLISQLNALGWMVDAKVLVDMFMEVTEWRNNQELVRKMTPEEQAHFQQSNPGMQKVQGQIAAIGARHQARSEEIDQQNEAQLARDMIGDANKQAAGWEERKWDRQAIEASPFAPA
jgi:hypothetical protein